MKEKTREPIPLVRIPTGENQMTELFMLDEGDSMAWNTSTHYDHHMQGPSFVTKTTGKGTQTHESYVNDPNAWKWVNYLMLLGKKYLEEHKDDPDFSVREFREECDRLVDEEYPKHRHVSMHKGKPLD